MLTERVESALDAMSRSELEKLVEIANKRLNTCIVCGNDSPESCLFMSYSVNRNPIRFGLDICPTCIAKHRKPVYKRGSGNRGSLTKDAPQP